MTRWLIAVLVVGTLLVGTNPGRQEFDEFVPAYVSRNVEAEAKARGDSNSATAGQVIGALVGVVLRALPVERKNFLAFSIFEVTLLIPDTERKCRFIGVAGQFVPLGECKLH